MSAKAEKKEEGAEGGKKKGGKLPIILALVLVLGGGGFFMMKGKGKEKKKEPEIKLAHAELEMKDEFTINLADGMTYARCKVAFLPKEGFQAATFDAHAGEVADAVITVIKSTKKEETLTEAHLTAMKMKIAAKLNKIFHEEKPEEEEESDKDTKKKKKKSDEDAGASHGKKKSSHDEEPVEEEEIPEGWHSAKGPILKVFFKAFATQ
ncbi:MAG: flagellar basal body-associated FliL family protein [Armatimonadota bacterium]